jgi:hypothetical protein
MATNTTDPNLPNYTRPELVNVTKDLTLVSDLLAGTRRMQDQSQAAGYIRKWTDEADGTYDIRRKIETVFEGLGRTLGSATGMLFAKSPGITWNKSETAMTPLWDNIDAAGTKGTVFVKRFAEASIRDGLGILLVDHTPAPPKDTLPLGTVTDDITKALGLRPTWAMYSRAQAINWRTGRVNNETRLTMIVFHECADVETGSFGIKTVHRYRVLRLENGIATWTLYEQIKTDAMSADAFAVVGSGTFTNRVGKAADFLPVAIGYTGRTDAPLCSTIPLLGVAWANLAHWQLSTTLRFSAEVAGYAQGVIVGEIAQEQGANGQMVPGKVRMGPLTLIHLKGDNASFEWKAPPVEAFAPLEVRIAEKLEQMGQMGMSFLTPDKRAAETVAAKRLDATAEFSTLATSAQGIEDAVNSAWEFTGWYLGIEKAGCPVTTINTDFEAITIEADVMGAYAQLIDKGYPKRLVLEAFQAGGRIGPDEDLELLESEWDAALAAKEDQQAIEAKAKERAFPQAA